MTDSASAFTAFVDADEVDQVLHSWTTLLSAVGVAEHGLGRFAHLEALLPPLLTYRLKAIFPLLRTALERRKRSAATLLHSLGGGPPNEDDWHVFVSGAGPVGLRGAVECAMLGASVTVAEMRSKFSRANILTLWPETHADLVALGAKYYYPDLQMVASPTHFMGTRQMQLTLLKTSLLLGVTFQYSARLGSLSRPAGLFNARWCANLHEVGSSNGATQARTTMATAGTATAAPVGGVDSVASATAALSFKPDKHARASVERTSWCNSYEAVDLDVCFVGGGDGKRATVATVPFDAMLIAEGEWSATTRSLGFDKTIDRFTLALGLIINMVYDPSEADQRGPKPFVVLASDPASQHRNRLDHLVSHFPCHDMT